MSSAAMYDASILAPSSGRGTVHNVTIRSGMSQDQAEQLYDLVGKSRRVDGQHPVSFLKVGEAVSCQVNAVGPMGPTPEIKVRRTK